MSFFHADVVKCSVIIKELSFEMKDNGAISTSVIMEGGVYFVSSCQRSLQVVQNSLYEYSTPST